MIHYRFVLLSALVICADNLNAQDQRVGNFPDHVLPSQIDVDRYPALSGPNQKLIDSLELALATKAPKERLNCVVDFAIEFVDHNNETALAIVTHAENLALNLGDSLSISRCLRIKGQVLWRLRRSEEAMKLFQVSLGISGRHHFDQEHLRALVPYGVVCIERSEYDKGLRGLTLAHQLAVALLDTTYMEAALNNLGVIYYKLKDYSKALNYWKAAVESKDRRNSRSFREHLNMSLAYANLKNFRSAREALNNCINICSSACGDEALIHINYASGFIFLGLKDYDEAERSLVESYRLSKKMQNARMLLDNIYLLADVYQKQQRIDVALSYLKQGEGVINSGVGFNLEVIKVYQRFADLYLDLKDFRKAAFYQSKYIQLKDSIYNEDLTTSLMKAEANYQERYNQAQIASQKELILLNEEIIERQRILNTLTVFLVILALACCLFLYRHYRLKQLMNVSLEQRIRERTNQLERSRNELLITLRERDLVIRRAEKETMETINTIAGLCHTAKEEENHLATYSYLERIEKLSGRLRAHLSVLGDHSRATLTEFN